MTTVEYLNGFLPAAFAVSMDEMTEATARAREWCEEDCQLEVPQEPVVRNLAADIARRICRRAYDCWEDAEEELNYELERRCENAFLAQLWEDAEEELNYELERRCENAFLAQLGEREEER